MVVVESKDGITAIGKILVSSGRVLVISPNVSKYSVGTNDDASPTGFDATKLT